MLSSTPRQAHWCLVARRSGQNYMQGRERAGSWKTSQTAFGIKTIRTNCRLCPRETGEENNIDSLQLLRGYCIPEDLWRPWGAGMVRGQPLEEETQPWRVGVQACSLHSLPTEPQLRLPANTELPLGRGGGVPVPEGMGTQGGTVGRCLLTTIQLLGKTVPNDMVSPPGPWPPSPSPSSFFENGIACLSCVWLRARPCHCLSQHKNASLGVRLFSSPQWGHRPWGIPDTIRGAERGGTEARRPCGVTMPLSGGAQGGLTGARRKAADMSRSGTHHRI